MKRSARSAEPTFPIADGQEVGAWMARLARRPGMGLQTSCSRKAKDGGPAGPEATRLRALNQAKCWLDKRLADAMRDEAGPWAVASGQW
mgnify:CR=1 FL=1